MDAALNAAEAVKIGNSSLSTYQQELQCAYNSANGCTISDQALNEADRQQVQALHSLQIAGSEAGSAAYSGVLVGGHANPFSDFYDLVTTDITAITHQLQDIASELIGFWIPQVHAAAVPSK